MQVYNVRQLHFQANLCEVSDLKHFKRRLSGSCPTVDRRRTIYSWTGARYTRTSLQMPTAKRRDVGFPL